MKLEFDWIDVVVFQPSSSSCGGRNVVDISRQLLLEQAESLAVTSVTSVACARSTPVLAIFRLDLRGEKPLDIPGLSSREAARLNTEQYLDCLSRNLIIYIYRFSDRRERYTHRQRERYREID